MTRSVVRLGVIASGHLLVITYKLTCLLARARGAVVYGSPTHGSSGTSAVK